MAYTNPWSDTLVPGSTPARDIDDKFRMWSLAVKERMETFLVKDWNADPVEPQEDLAGTVTGKTIVIGGSSFRELNGSLKAVELNPNFLAVFRGSARVIAPVILPPGVTIKLIELQVNRGDVTNFTWRLIAVGFDTTAVETVVASSTVTNAGMQVFAQALSHTVSAAAAYYVDLDTAGAADVNSMRLYAVRLTYDTPDVTKTL